MTTLRLAAVGDVSLGDQPSCFGFGVRGRHDRNRYASLIRDARIADALQQADLAFANLECAYNDAEPMKLASHFMCASRTGLHFLHSLGIRMVDVANNHVLERGAAGLRELTAALDALGIVHVGLDPVHIGEYGRKRIAFRAYSAVPDFKHADAMRLWHDDELETIRRAAADVDFCIVAMHWGNEFVDVPSREQIRIGHALVEAGADLVLGAHPHVLQPVERYQDRLIAYSLGNFIFDGCMDNTFLSAVFTFDIDLDTRRSQFQVLPVVASPRDYSLTVAEGDLARRIEEQIAGRVTPLSDDDYNRRVLEMRHAYRRAVLDKALRNAFRFRDRLGILAWALKRIFFIIKNRKRERRDPNEVYTWK
ncbi:MAG TPA: CapA family protein [Candidatus Hydrogenedentes bacterium]|nr:CapA family protein [Candidatus Hydrogenedentota bacterium]HPG69622.1 CapA family protein [Candidatus Hydrogenedentota bacterium]